MKNFSVFFVNYFHVKACYMFYHVIPQLFHPFTPQRCCWWPSPSRARTAVISWQVVRRQFLAATSHHLLQFYCSQPCRHLTAVIQCDAMQFIIISAHWDLITIMAQLSVITVVVEGAHSDKTETKPVLTIRSPGWLQADNSSPSVLSQFRGYHLLGRREEGGGRMWWCNPAGRGW